MKRLWGPIALALAFVVPAQAQDYPVKDIHAICNDKPGAPKPIVDRLEAWFNRIVAMEDTKKFLNNLGSEPFPGNRAMLRELIVGDTERWGEYVRLANIKPQ